MSHGVRMSRQEVVVELDDACDRVACAEAVPPHVGRQEVLQFIAVETVPLPVIRKDDQVCLHEHRAQLGERPLEPVSRRRRADAGGLRHQFNQLGVLNEATCLQFCGVAHLPTFFGWADRLRSGWIDGCNRG